MNEITLYKSPLKALRLIALSSLFVIPSVYFLATEQTFRKPHTETILWISTCFFSLGYVVGFINLFDRRPQITIKREGIWDRRLKFDRILWVDILDAYLYHIRTPLLKTKSQSFISIVLTPEVSDKIKSPKWVENFNYEAGAQKANINVSDISVNKDKLLNAIIQLTKEQPKNRAAIISKLNLK